MELTKTNTVLSLSKGFKQTEVGMIPEDWDIQPLGNLTSLMTNGFVGVAKLHYTDSTDGILYIQGYNVKENAFNFNGIKRVTKEFHLKNSKSNLREGDLLTVQTGDVGLTTIIPKELVGSNCHALIISRFKSGFNSKFFSLYLNSIQGRSRLKEIETGTTMKHINVGELIHFIVPIPTLAEQTAIATALSDADAWINSLEKLIAKKRLVKQGAMQELLKPKEGWEVKSLGEICDVRDGTHQTPKYVKTGIPFYSVESVTNNNFFNTKFISEEEHKLLTKSFKIERGDILMTRIGSIGDCKLVDWEVNASFYVSLALLKIKEGYSANYIYHYSKTAAFKKEADINSLQSAIPRKINLGPISLIKIHLPDLNEQTRIATILSDMEGELDKLVEKLATAKQVKQGMMQELLTGRVRLV